MEEPVVFVLQYLIFPLIIGYCGHKWSDKKDR